MSFAPKPVNFTLNRDMLGKILSHTREDMANEVTKMTFRTKGDTLTLEQAQLYLLGLDLNVCSEPGCMWVEEKYHDTDWFRCAKCNKAVCYGHAWFIDGHQYEHTCSDCHIIICECGDMISYNGDRVSYHRCNSAKDI